MDILENQILGHIKATDRPELVEKVIINLSLKEFPKELLQELVEYCEENCLSSALFYLHTSVNHAEEEAQCVPVILSLMQLYRDAKRNNPGSLEEIRCIKDLPADSEERLSAEKSQIYLGYKILWAIRLFLNGKKFPHGSFSEDLWRSCVFELIDCISQSQVMLDLLYIDSEAYFQIVSIIFYKGKVFDFIQSGKAEQKEPTQDRSMSISNPFISEEVFDELMPKLSHK